MQAKAKCKIKVSETHILFSFPRRPFYCETLTIRIQGRDRPFCGKPSIALQLTAFHRAVCRLLQAEIRQIAKPLAVSVIEAGRHRRLQMCFNCRYLTLINCSGGGKLRLFCKFATSKPLSSRSRGDGLTGLTRRGGRYGRWPTATNTVHYINALAGGSPPRRGQARRVQLMSGRRAWLYPNCPLGRHRSDIAEIHLLIIRPCVHSGPNANHRLVLNRKVLGGLSV